MNSVISIWQLRKDQTPRRWIVRPDLYGPGHRNSIKIQTPLKLEIEHELGCFSDANNMQREERESYSSRSDVYLL